MHDEELKELYQEMILDHGRHPRNHHAMKNYDHVMEGFNPICGDKLKLFVKLNGDIIEDISFEASGCAISIAAASMMSEHLKGMKINDAKDLFIQFQDLITQDGVEPAEALGKLKILAGVRQFPMRVKCATLAWHALIGAVDGSKDTVSTESEEE